jgi:hypothetical protein
MPQRVFPVLLMLCLGPAWQAHAQTRSAGDAVSYTWSGEGTVIGLLDPSGGPKIGGQTICATRKGTIDLSVTGTRAKGLFQRVGRQSVNFDVTLSADGTFKTEAKDEPFVPSDLSQHKRPTYDLNRGHAKSGLDDGLWHISGVIAEGNSRIHIEGPCVYAGPLTRK